jgi:hypothetical protein
MVGQLKSVLEIPVHSILFRTYGKLPTLNLFLMEMLIQRNRVMFIHLLVNMENQNARVIFS